MPIREFDVARDYAAVRAVWEGAGPGVRVGPSDTAAEIAKKLTRDPDLFLVVEDEGQIVGAVLGGFDGRRGMVYHLAVAAPYRGRGLGTALLTELEARLRAKGCRKYYLLVTHDNAEMIEFYRQRGWSLLQVHVMGREIT